MIRKLIDKYKMIPIQVKASFWFLVCAFFQKGLSFITTPIFTRLMSTTEYGQYNVFNSWMAILSVVITMNLSSGVYTQGLIKFKKERHLFTSSLIGLTTTMVIIWATIYLLFHDFFNELLSLTTVQVLALFVIVWVSSIFLFWSTDQRVDFKYRKLVMVTIIVSILQPTLGIFLVLHANDKVTARILGIVAVELIVYVRLFITEMHKGKKIYSRKFWIYALQFNLPLIPHYLSTNILSVVDRIMIDKMVGSSEAGVYSLAYSISMIMTILNSALLKTLEPWLYKKINLKQTEDISRVAYPTLLTVAGANLLLIAFAPEIIAIFAPSEYYDAIWVIPPVAMSVFFMFAYTFFATFEFYFEKTKYIAIATLSGAVLNIILNYIFISIFGYYAAGYTTLLCYIVFALCHFLFMKKICKDKLNGAQVYDARTLLIISVSFIALGFIFLSTYRNIRIRYSLLLTAIFAIIIKRKVIVGTLKKIMLISK